MTINLQKFLLILVRMTTFIAMCPGFSFQGFPNVMKVAFSVSISAIVYKMIPDMATTNSFFYFAVLMINEVLFGLAIGYISKLIFAMVEVAGDLIDFQVGFSMASVYDKSVGTTASNYGKVYYWMAISIFFLLDLHHLVLESFINSFQVVSLGGVSFEKFKVEALIYTFSKTLETAFNMAAPMIIAVLTTDIILGIISKTIPQINVLILGMPIKALVGYVIAFFSLSWIMDFIGKHLLTLPKYMDSFYKMLS